MSDAEGLTQEHLVVVARDEGDEAFALDISKEQVVDMNNRAIDSEFPTKILGALGIT